MIALKDSGMLGKVPMTNPAIQPTLCVIGHGLAANPLQFSVTRALRATGLDWRFASFDVAPDQFDVALRGALALGMAGIAIADPFHSAAVDVVEVASDSVRRSNWTDVLVQRGGTWVSENALGRAVADQCAANFEAIEHVIVLGAGPRGRAVAAEFACRQIKVGLVATDGDAIADEFLVANPEIEIHRSCHALSTAPPSPVVHADSLQASQACLDKVALDTLREISGVVQLAIEAEVSPISNVPVISGVEIAVHWILGCFRDWSDCETDAGLLREAIEEYFEL